jgi:hypothetical protein
MNQFDVPVLVLGFNRPDRVRLLIERLRTVKPERIFFAVDGPRTHVEEDRKLVAETQSLVDQFNWGCEVLTHFQESNLGCAEGVTAGINWFFTQVSEGVILEDDVIPSESFFQYSAELLEKFRSDQRVWCICGSNRLPATELSTEFSYRFSAVPQVWGWATWSDRWDSYSLDIQRWRSKGLSNRQLFKAVGYSPAAFLYWSANFELMAKMAVDTWDIQLVNAAMRNQALAVIPNVNLVENIGWGADATHTKEVPRSIQQLETMQFPLKHPLIEIDSKADRYLNRLVYQATTLGLVQQFLRYLKKK